MKEDIRVMNITTGDEVDVYFESMEDAVHWIESQDVPDYFEIMEDVF